MLSSSAVPVEASKTNFTAPHRPLTKRLVVVESWTVHNSLPILILTPLRGNAADTGSMGLRHPARVRIRLIFCTFFTDIALQDASSSLLMML